MTVHEISQVYGFTLDNKEFLKLLLAKLAENPYWAGEVETCDSIESEDPRGAEWTHEDKIYSFMDFAYSFRLGSDKGQEKARELFPELPAGVKLFHNFMDHSNTWYLGVEVSYENAYNSKRRSNIIDPVKLIAHYKQILDHLVAQYKSILDRLFGSYGHLFKEKSGQPVLFEVSDDCDCCS
jgi:hypothetical protein